MKLREWFKAPKAAVKASRAGALFSLSGVMCARWTPRRYDRLAEEAYRKNVVAFRCISLVATSAAGIPWLLYD